MPAPNSQSAINVYILENHACVNKLTNVGVALSHWVMPEKTSSTLVFIVSVPAGASMYLQKSLFIARSDDGENNGVNYSLLFFLCIFGATKSPVEVMLPCVMMFP